MPRGKKAPLTRWYYQWAGTAGITKEEHYEERDARYEVRKTYNLNIIPAHAEFWREEAV